MNRYRLKTVTFLACETTDAPVDCSERSAELARSFLANEDQDVEHFGIVALSARGRPTGIKVVASGTLTACLVHPREAFRTAIALSAAQVVIFHNHPSGDPSPSDEDRDLTDRLVDAGRILGIPVIDHVIVTAGGKWASIPID